ncbi:MAG: WD40 repeat domain-containing protein [Planctomycetaceae bacterium]
MPADPNQLKIAQQIGRQEIAFCLDRAKGSSKVYFGASDGKAYELDLGVEKPEAVPLEGHEGFVTGIAVCEKVLITGAYDGQLIWRDLTTREIIRKLPAHQKWIRKIAASPDLKLIASVADDMKCHLWNVETGELVRTLEGHQPLTPQHYPSMLFAAVFSADGQYLATADKVGHIVVWEVASGNQLAALEAPLMYTWDPNHRRHSIGGIRSLAFSADGMLLATGGTGQIGNVDHLEALARIEIFDWKKGERTHEFPGDEVKGLVEFMAFQPEGNWLVAVGGDHGGFVKFIDLKEKKIIKQITAPGHIFDARLNDTQDALYIAAFNNLLVCEFKAAV